MKNFLIIVFLLFTPFLINAQNTYYVSSSQGNDSNNGTSENSPWKSIEKINSSNLQLGDKILFHCGDKWIIKERFVIKNSGIPQMRIYIGSYGNGKKPIISMMDNLPGWNVAENWHQYNSTIWYIDVPGLNSIYAYERMWFNGTEYLNSAGIEGANNWDGTYGINSTHRFFNAPGSNRFYVYAISNPATYYSNIEYQGPDDFVVYITGSYTTFDNLEFRGGHYVQVAVRNGADHVNFNNCTIGYGAGYQGLSIYDKNGNFSDYNSIKNSTIDSHYRLTKLFYGTQLGPAAQGVSLSFTRYDTVYGNTIVDWMQGVGIGWTNHGIIIDSNDISAPNNGFAKPINIAGKENGSWEEDNTNVTIIRNYFHDLKNPILCYTNNNVVAFNIFANIYRSGDNEHGDAAGYTGAMVIMNNKAIYGSGYPTSNKIFNNTVYNTTGYAFHGGNDSTQIFNNLCVKIGGFQPSKVNNIKYVLSTSNSYNKVTKNNIFNVDGKNNDSDPIIYYNDNSITVSQYEKFNQISGMDIEGNKMYTDGIEKLVNIFDFTLPDNSIALGKGCEITSYIPKGFKDRLGNIVDRIHPNIGAIDNKLQSTTGFKVYLEGPYKDGIMNISLNSNNNIPTAQPYNISPWNYNGNESVSTIPKNIVDWILVELRNSTSPSSVIAKRAAFLRNDGSITDLDGISPLTFDKTGSYYVVIKHRNHLAIMSSQPVHLINSTIQYDFTTSESKAYGSNSLADLGNGAYGMYGGDSDGNGIIENSDIIYVSQKLFNNGYFTEDSDMNSPVNVLDYKLPNINLSKASNVQ